MYLRVLTLSDVDTNYNWMEQIFNLLTRGSYISKLNRHLKKMTVPCNKNLLELYINVSSWVHALSSQKENWIPLMAGIYLPISFALYLGYLILHDYSYTVCVFIYLNLPSLFSRLIQILWGGHSPSLGIIPTVIQWIMTWVKKYPWLLKEKWW